MRKFRSRLAIILAMVMVFTSFTFVGVFADNESVDGTSVVEEQTPEAEAPAVKAPGGDSTDTPGDTTSSVEAPSAVTGLKAYASSNSMVLLWDIPAEDQKPDGYLINGVDVKNPTIYKDKNNKEYYRYNIGGLADGQAAGATVYAYNLDGDEKIKSEEQKAIRGAVGTIRYRVRIKKGGTLKAHGGSGPRSIYVSKGQYIDCYGFGGGKYIFNYQGSIFYCNKSRTNKRYCLYDGSFSYSPQEAEFFVNDRGLSSGTGVLVWINTYTQTMYMFKGSAGKWQCVLASKCSTGKAASPTPTGVSGVKTIWKKIGKRHGIKYWSPFSQINSVHSKKAKWRMGYPASNGCVRNYIDAAQQVYYGAPIGTTVLVY